jgi:methionyl aminopeptidase
MALIKTAEEIALLRESGKRLAHALDAVEAAIRPGISTKMLDQVAEQVIRAGGDEPSFLNYTPDGVSRPYPATLCVSVNDQVVHGIPRDDKILQEGDMVSIDLGLSHQGLHTDMARTVAVGMVDSTAESLIAATKEALAIGIKEARAGNTVGDISAAVESIARKYGFSIVEELGGHGIGRSVHEDPFIPNFGKKGSGLTLMPGMVLAIEPIFNEGTPDVKLSFDDHYTFTTKDGLRSAHFEHTVLITENDPEILTRG